MEFMLPIYRMLHFFGFALLLGGTLCSFVLIRKESASVASARLAYNCMHLIAAPGLILLLFTGVLQSAALYWEHFKDAGYMHLKVLLTLIILVLLFIDLRTEKNILRQNPPLETLVFKLKKRQALAFTICILTVLVMWLVSYRPF